MKYKIHQLSLAALILSANAMTTHANETEFSRAADELCDKMTVCIVEQISADEDLPPQMKDMAKEMAKGMCASFYEFEEVVERADLVSSALACFKSIETLECAAFIDGFETPECKEFERLGEQYSDY